jgi:hypothetical protein
MALTLNPSEVDNYTLKPLTPPATHFPGWTETGFAPPIVPVKHNHYFKDVSKLDNIDVYRVLSLFNVTDPCIQHATKKLLVAGGRGAGKDINKDIQEAIDSLVRYQKMRVEDGE